MKPFSVALLIFSKSLNSDIEAIISGDFKYGVEFEKNKTHLERMFKKYQGLKTIDLFDVDFMDTTTMAWVSSYQGKENFKIEFDETSYVYKRFQDFLKLESEFDNVF